jgi:ATP-binding cassette subfamily C (CFTR/MRP) protein 1
MICVVFGMRRMMNYYFRIALTGLLGASLDFFQRSKTGRVLQRLSTDLVSIDQRMPMGFMYIGAKVAGILSALLIVFVSNPQTLVLLLVMVPYVSYYVRYYRPTIYDIRKLTPLVSGSSTSLITEALNGSLSLSVFNVKESFEIAIQSSLNRLSSLSITSLGVTTWASFRLQLLQMMIVLGVTLSALISNVKGSFYAAQIGIALLSISVLPAYILQLVQLWTGIENHVPQNRSNSFK